MPYLTDLADAARKSGLPVVELPGWKTRGHGPMTAVETIAVHHTATSQSAAGDYPSLRIVRDGRSDLPGPLAQLGLGRSGTVYVIAAGVSYHAGETFRTVQNNWHAIGIEAEHDGLSPWDPDQYAAYARLCHALCDHYGLTVADVQGHKEIAAPLGRKTDPNFDMGAFRDATANAQEDPMADYAKQLDRIEANQKQILDRLGKTAVIRASLAALRKQGRVDARDLEQIIEKLDELAADDA